MGLDNPIHIAFLLVLLLVVFGAKRLPEMGRSLGGGLRGFRDALSGDVRAPAAPASVTAPVSVTAADAVPARLVEAAPAAVEAVPEDAPARVSASGGAGRVSASGGSSDEPLAAA